MGNIFKCFSEKLRINSTWSDFCIRKSGADLHYPGDPIVVRITGYTGDVANITYIRWIYIEMSLLRMISPAFLARLLKLTHGNKKQISIRADESETEETIPDLSLESIKNMIIEAYADVDKYRQARLLEKADRLEQKLVASYRSKGLIITADNIGDTLKMHRRRHNKRTY